jgi:hypothetical protein
MRDIGIRKWQCIYILQGDVLKMNELTINKCAVKLKVKCIKIPNMLILDHSCASN